MGLAADDENLWVSDRDTGKVWQIIATGEAMDEPLLVTQDFIDRRHGACA